MDIASVSVILVCLVAALFVLDVLRKRRSEKPRLPKAATRVTAADDVGPTQTGRFRAQSMLAGQPSKLRPPPSKGELPSEEKVSALSPADEEALPDPFDNKN